MRQIKLLQSNFFSDREILGAIPDAKGILEACKESYFVIRIVMLIVFAQKLWISCVLNRVIFFACDFIENVME